MMCWQQEKRIEKELMCFRSMLAPNVWEILNLVMSEKNQSFMWRQLNLIDIVMFYVMCWLIKLRHL